MADQFEVFRNNGEYSFYEQMARSGYHSVAHGSGPQVDMGGEIHQVEYVAAFLHKSGRVVRAVGRIWVDDNSVLGTGYTDGIDTVHTVNNPFRDFKNEHQVTMSGTFRLTDILANWAP